MNNELIYYLSINLKEEINMKSTDMNINNPLSIDSINMQRTTDYQRAPKIEFISAFLYDRLVSKDPMTIYVISEPGVERMYLGDILIEEQKTSCKYLMGVDDDTHEYLIIMHIKQPNGSRLVPITRYTDINVAVNVLLKYNNAMSHQKDGLSIYTSISAYIDKFIDINDLIISIIAMYGYKNDPRLQKIINVYNSYHQNNDPLMSSLFITQLQSFADTYNNKLFYYYKGLYEVIEKYDFFKDDKYHHGDLPNLSSAVKDIEDVMNGITSIT